MFYQTGDHWPWVLPQPVYYATWTTPAKTAALCPVCKGNGKVLDAGDQMARTCHGCDGKGWVAV